MVDEGPSQWDGHRCDGEGISKEISQFKRELEEAKIKRKKEEDDHQKELKKKMKEAQVASKYFAEVNEARERVNKDISSVYYAKLKEIDAFLKEMSDAKIEDADLAISYYYSEIEKEKSVLSYLKHDEFYTYYDEGKTDKLSSLLKEREIEFSNSQTRWKRWVDYKEQSSKVVEVSEQTASLSNRSRILILTAIILIVLIWLNDRP